MWASVQVSASPTCCPNLDDSSVVAIFVTMLLIGGREFDWWRCAEKVPLAEQAGGLETARDAHGFRGQVFFDGRLSPALRPWLGHRARESAFLRLR